MFKKGEEQGIEFFRKKFKTSFISGKKQKIISLSYKGEIILYGKDSNIRAKILLCS